MIVSKSTLKEYLKHHPETPPLEAVNALYRQSGGVDFHLDSDVLPYEDLQRLAVYTALNRWHTTDLHRLFVIIAAKASSEPDYYFLLKVSGMMMEGEQSRLKLLHQYFSKRPRCSLEHIFVLIHAVDEEEKKVQSVLSQAIFKATYYVEDYLFLQKVWTVKILPEYNSITSTFRQLFRLLIENGKFDVFAETAGETVWTLYRDLFQQYELQKMIG
ncbi:MAG: hypothetical protein HQM13_13915 [SAR324 cluster bacterium]|nr:hypothetical protein [SAR324 cluster bacterium]